VSYEALIAAQAKRLTKKRERGFMQYDWPSAEQITDRFDRMAWRDDCRAYADLYVPPAPGSYGFDGLRISVCSKCLETKCHCPEPVELSHMEWADGYKEWQANRRLPPCFAENEI
jgi:hypothetical protein